MPGGMLGEDRDNASSNAHIVHISTPASRSSTNHKAASLISTAFERCKAPQNVVSPQFCTIRRSDDAVPPDKTKHTAVAHQFGSESIYPRHRIVFRAAKTTPQSAAAGQANLATATNRFAKSCIANSHASKIVTNRAQRSTQGAKEPLRHGKRRRRNVPACAPAQRSNSYLTTNTLLFQIYWLPAPSVRSNLRSPHLSIGHARNHPPDSNEFGASIGRLRNCGSVSPRRLSQNSQTSLASSTNLRQPTHACRRQFSQHRVQTLVRRMHARDDSQSVGNSAKVVSDNR